MMRRATKYFQQVFRRYDDLNNSVQENVSAIRVVKAYVREEYEISKFQKAAENIYQMFIKAEMNIAGVSPVMMTVVYSCILLISWFGAHMIVGGSSADRAADEPSRLQHEHPDEPDDAVHGLCDDHHVPGQRKANRGGHRRKE